MGYALGAMVSPVIHVTCPQCAANVEGLTPGVTKRCQYCGTELHMPAPTAQNPQPQVMVLDMQQAAQQLGQAMQQLGPALNQAMKVASNLQGAAPTPYAAPPPSPPRRGVGAGMVALLAFGALVGLMVIGGMLAFFATAR